MSTPRFPTGSVPDQRGWTFLSNHAHVLICLAANPDLRLREVALRVGITERAVQKILADLEAEGLVEREREGRNNRYLMHLDRPLRHPLEAHRSVRELIELVTGGQKSAGVARTARKTKPNSKANSKPQRAR